ncbi:MAG: RnfABCDGE type electron transport complex subunit D [Pseudomonadota bacterium]|nr:RnfABCDGE type electron transport complex subunit D [Pseudomonadota bacterium]MDP1904320.1 RnfABCDGE type electron transport complex subunit D [Pseudomonadota bacterium]MDP2352394.1 RnfABCDGE type electron transport complex subunit D [Pseudomonadota bacterium]
MNGSPYLLRGNNSVTLVMLKVLAALIPGIIAHVWFFGPGIVVSLLLCTAFAIGFETLFLLMRGMPLKPFLTDGSVVVTACLLALAMPTLAPWWLYLTGIFFAVVVAKHFYGGLGQNLFNPAMVGYAALIVSFPVYMTQWVAPLGIAQVTPDLWEAFDLVFAGAGAISPDAYTSATPLDVWKTQARQGIDAANILAQPIFGWAGGHGREIVALMYLAGGLLLVANRVATWHVPVAFLLAMALTAGSLHLLDPAHHAPPLFHLFSGGAMLCAFFIATDPVTAASTPLGKLIYAGLAGFLVIIIRAFGGYPDGIAFAVLLMNVAVPFIDAYTQPRVFGHKHGGKRGQA